MKNFEYGVNYDNEIPPFLRGNTKKELPNNVKKLIELNKEYKKHGLEEFNTIFMTIDEQIKILENCLKTNKSYYELYNIKPNYEDYDY